VRRPGSGGEATVSITRYGSNRGRSDSAGAGLQESKSCVRGLLQNYMTTGVELWEGLIKKLS
jgi:hypothetical protein